MKTIQFTTKTRTVLADLQTPVGIYLKVRDMFPESVLLESSDFHGNENSESFIGINPMARFEVKNDRLTLTYTDESSETIDITPEKKLTDYLHEFIGCFQQKEESSDNSIGFFGYTSYNAIRYFEEKPVINPETGNIPEMLYIFYRYVLIINHFKNEMTLVENLMEGESSGIEQILDVLNNRNYASYNFCCLKSEKSNMNDEDYKELVKKGIHHCLRGDVFQVVFSRCFMQSFSGDEFKVYRALRSINPSPYLFYFDFGSFRIFGSSPEIHCGISQKQAYMDPIAGTFRRSGDSETDKILSEKLLKDPKENAEHVMLVDLARNDLGKNTSNVKLAFYKEVKFYSHVIHLVSRVIGDVKANSNTFQIFADTFPAGTLTGAPKIRAMELIRDIEPTSRGIYGGCIGFIGLNGNFNQAITIRSFLSKENTLYYQAGAGIVAKSDPEMELQEVNNKLGALKEAIVIAEKIIN